MKKIVSIMIGLALFVAFAPSSFATDICSNDPLSSANFYVKTNSAVYLRDISCMDSNITATLPAGELLHVIGKTEGWHKVVRADGSQGWLWETFLVSTNETFSNPTPTPEPTPEPEPVVTQDPMYDIYGHKYENAIWHVYNNGIVSGYPDGSYKPDKAINRAELLKIIVESSYDESEFDEYSNRKCFSDVDPGLWYTKYVCFAKTKGIVEGYPDGSFKPAQEIIFVEALKIATAGFGHAYEEGTPWYKNTVEYASSLNIIPLDIYAFNQSFKRGQMAEMITRMLKYQESEQAFADYLGDKAEYKVTYETIEASINVESLIGKSLTYTNTMYDFTLEVPSTWIDVTENVIPGDELYVQSVFDPERYFGIYVVGLDYKDTVLTGEFVDTKVVHLGDTDEYAIFMMIYYCKNVMPTCGIDGKLPAAVLDEIDLISETFVRI